MQTKLFLLGAFAAAALFGQNQPVLGEDTVKVSDHVWAIMGWPNIAIIVGNRATLVVDTGLGSRNGATIARVVAKVDPAIRSCSSRRRTSIPSMPAEMPGSPLARS